VGVLTAYSQDYTAFLQTPRYLAHFPFEVFGLGALVILFFMAVTSHDFWLCNLGPSFWKLMHMGVYAAYGLVLTHVFYGALQAERNPFYRGTGCGFCRAGDAAPAGLPEGAATRLAEKRRARGGVCAGGAGGEIARRPGAHCGAGRRADCAVFARGRFMRCQMFAATKAGRWERGELWTAA